MTDALFPLLRRAAAVTALALTIVSPASADGRLTAKYELSVGGIELGRGAVVVEAGDAAYEMSGSARLSGVLRAVSSGKGNAAARGTISQTRLSPRVFAMTAEADGKQELVRLGITNGAVKEQEVAPPLKFYPDRVEITDAHLANVIDPMSGAFLYVPGTADLMSAGSCERTIPVFDGRQRYDLTLKYVRTEKVKTDGYNGPALVCQVRYTPVSGHRPSRYTVKYMVDNKDIYVWLVPIAGSRLMAPFRVSVATMIGTALLEATSFQTEAKPTTASIPRN